MFTCGPAFYKGVTASAGDPSFSSVKLLCHFDGTNGQASTIDSASPPHTIQTGGGAVLSSAQSKFGGTSFAPSGSATFSTPASVDWAFGSAPFTIETWAYFSAAPGTANLSLLAQWVNSGNLGWYFGMISGALSFYYSTTGSNNPSVAASWTPALNTWHHVAVDRDASNVIRVYVNGAVIASASVGTVSLFQSSSNMYIGAVPGTFGGISGFMDEVRITKGVARYAGAFTPPTAAFPNS